MIGKPFPTISANLELRMEEGLNETAQPVPKAVDKHESDNASHAAQPEAEGELRDANLYEYLHGMRFVLVTISCVLQAFYTPHFSLF